jgi:ABC-type multidrug transport system ATPase subunit
MKIPAEIITVKNLSATFGQRQILQNVSFTARKNDITVILGTDIAECIIYRT